VPLCSSSRQSTRSPGARDCCIRDVEVTDLASLNIQTTTNGLLNGFLPSFLLTAAPRAHQASHSDAEAPQPSSPCRSIRLQNRYDIREDVVGCLRFTESVCWLAMELGLGVTCVLRKNIHKNCKEKITNTNASAIYRRCNDYMSDSSVKNKVFT
jgi:hypothetical protein